MIIRWSRVLLSPFSGVPFHLHVATWAFTIPTVDAQQALQACVHSLGSHALTPFKSPSRSGTVTKWWVGDLLSICRLSAITCPCLSLDTIRALNWGELTPSGFKVYGSLTCFLYYSFLLVNNYFSSGHFPWDLGLHWRESCSDAFGKANVVVVRAQRLLQAAPGPPSHPHSQPWA